MITMHVRELEPLSASALQLADPADDLRGRTVCDRTGASIGTVEEVWFDGDKLRARMVEVSHGGLLGLGQRHQLIPMEAIRGRDEKNVYVDRDRDEIVNGPEFWSDDITDMELHYLSVYSWYGLAPYWEVERQQLATAGAHKTSLDSSG